MQTSFDNLQHSLCLYIHTFVTAMPVGPVDDKGTSLYFEDSGAPKGSLDYVTLVLVHGAMIHSSAVLFIHTKRRD